MKNNKEKLTHNLLKAVAACGMKTSEISANTACWYMLHQDKAPDALNKLRKVNGKNNK